MSPRAWACFAAVSVLWGIPYLFIKIAVDDGLSPVFVSWARCALGAAVLLPIAWRLGILEGLAAGGRWKYILAFTVLEIAIPFPLIAFGETRVSSSLAAILIAAVPLMVALLAVRFDPSERVTGGRLVGLFVGLGGVIVLVGVDIAGKPDEMLGAAAILLAAVGYAAGPMIIKRKFGDADPRGLAAVALGLAALVLTVPAGFALPAATPSGGSLASIAVLGLLCSAAAFVLFFTLIAEAGPGRATVITYIAPTVAVALGVTLLGEHIGIGAGAGLLLILAGSWLSTDGRLPPGITRAIARLKPAKPTESAPQSQASAPA